MIFGVVSTSPAPLTSMPLSRSSTAVPFPVSLRTQLSTATHIVCDFVIPWFQGGGECGIDNLRTLCVLCHAEVTRVQTTERAATRRIDKERKRRWVRWLVIAFVWSFFSKQQAARASLLPGMKERWDNETSRGGL